jgi:hypothetical protein
MFLPFALAVKFAGGNNTEKKSYVIFVSVKVCVIGLLSE